MEELKPLHLVTTPDERNRFRNLTLEILHAIATDIRLNPTVPEHVRNQFEIARNAFLYSWFWYPFQPAALMYSILAVELALKLRLKADRQELFQRKYPPTLSELLGTAIRDRLLVDDGFDVTIPDEALVRIDPNNPKSPAAPRDQRYCYTILYALPSLRNDLAHGEYLLAPGMSHLLARGAELINQLFPMPAQPAPGAA